MESIFSVAQKRLNICISFTWQWVLKVSHFVQHFKTFLQIVLKLRSFFFFFFCEQWRSPDSHQASAWEDKWLCVVRGTLPPTDCGTMISAALLRDTLKNELFIEKCSMLLKFLKNWPKQSLRLDLFFPTIWHLLRVPSFYNLYKVQFQHFVVL